MLVFDPESKSEGEVARSCPTLCDPVDSSPSGSFIHGIFWKRVLERVAVSFSRGSSQPRNRTRVSCISGRRFTAWATRESLNLPLISLASGKSFNRSVLLRLWRRKNNSYLPSVSWCEGLNNLLHIHHLEQHLVLNNSIKFAFICYFLPHYSLVVFGWRLARPKQPCHRNSYNTWIMGTKFCVSAGLPGGAAVKNQLASAGDAGSIPGSGRSPGGRYENPLQHSCLENSVDRGAWWAIVHVVAKE